MLGEVLRAAAAAGVHDQREGRHTVVGNVRDADGEFVALLILLQPGKDRVRATDGYGNHHKNYHDEKE
jgi:hypothetical protein